jgi:hypothetical protein
MTYLTKSQLREIAEAAMKKATLTLIAPGVRSMSERQMYLKAEAPDYEVRQAQIAGELPLGGEVRLIPTRKEEQEARS